ncbi:hypothetical protein DFH11DRAFT_150790 [Phellopilus nigrolimitatus]|nr:hypothetical protein DFH11DRAFT_150790 [Phellopilus nigrolimitatus]
MPSTSPDSGSDSESLALDAVFTEPPRPPSPAPTVVTYTRTRAPLADDDAEKNKLRKGSEAPDGWTTVELRLVGSHPLWAHHLYGTPHARLRRTSTEACACTEGRTSSSSAQAAALPALSPHSTARVKPF